MVHKRRAAFFLLTILVLSGFPLSTPAHAVDKGYKSKVVMLADHKYFDALISGIRKAEKDITGCFFLFKASEVRSNLPMAIVNELIAARKRGVNVSIELEQAASGKGVVYEQNRKAATLMTDAGIRVRFDAPKTITHVKAMVIDRRYVYIGSHNLTQSALKYNNELSVMIDSPEFASEVTSYLDKL